MAAIAPSQYLGANKDELRQALAVQGYDASFLDEDPVRIGAQPAPAPQTQQQAPVAKPVEQPQPQPQPNVLDQALQVSGSDYRVSAPSQRPTRASIGQLQETLVGGVNESMDLATRKGEIASTEASRQAEQFGMLQQEQRAGLEAAKREIGGNKERRARLEKEADEALERMSEAVKNPPDATRGKALQIVGSIMGMLPGGKAIGGGFQMLSNAMREDMQAYTMKIENDRDAAKTFTAMAGAEDDENESLLRQQHLIGTVTAATYDSALKQIEAESTSEEQKRAAQEARLKIRQEYTSSVLGIEEKRFALEQQRRSAGVRNAADDAIIKALVSAPSPEAASAIAAQYGDHGLDLLDRVTKSDAATAGVAKTQAEAEKASRDGSTDGVRNKIEVEGLRSLPNATPQDKTKAQEIVNAQIDLDAALAEMQRLQGQGGKETSGLYSVQMKLAIGALNSLSNAGVLNPGELQAWLDSLPQHRYDNATTVNPLQRVKAMLTDEERFLGNMRDTFKVRNDRKLRTYNYERAPTAEVQSGVTDLAGQPTQQRSAPKSGTSMINPQTGQWLPSVVPSKVEALKGMGFVLGRPSTEQVAQPQQVPVVERDEYAGQSGPRRTLREGGI